MDYKDLNRLLQSKTIDEYYSSSNGRKEEIIKAKPQETERRKTKSNSESKPKIKTIKCKYESSRKSKLTTKADIKEKKASINNIVKSKKINVIISPVIIFLIVFYFIIVYSTVLGITFIHVNLFNDKMFMTFYSIALVIATVFYVLMSFGVSFFVISSAKKCAKKAIRDGGFQNKHLVPALCYFIGVFFSFCICSIIAFKFVSKIFDNFSSSFFVIGFISMVIPYCIFAIITILVIRKTAINACL